MQKIDENIVLFIQGIRCEPLTTFFNIFIPLEFWAVTSIIIVLFSFFRTRTLRVPLVSFVLAGWLSDHCYGFIKILVHRPRPFLTVKGLVPLITPHGFSFPSGHATLAMAMAVILAHHFPRVRSLVYVLAILVGFSRIYFGVHFLSDVLAGFILGAILGWLCIIVERTIISVNQGVDFCNKRDGHNL